MHCDSDNSHFLKVRDSGVVEIPADIARRIGLSPGDRVVVTQADGGLEVSAAATEPDQFIRWRSISHQVLAESA